MFLHMYKNENCRLDTCYNNSNELVEVPLSGCNFFFLLQKSCVLKC